VHNLSNWVLLSIKFMNFDFVIYNVPESKDWLKKIATISKKMELRLTYISGCPLKVMADSEMDCPDYIRSCMEDCWAEQPEQRPDFPTIRDRLRKMREGM